ncbi:MAG: hypothetical protein HY321_11940 [Armatimonadetes bacterium]|nr:hypothetical protein [Armatimonadota bacterium]
MRAGLAARLRRPAVLRGRGLGGATLLFLGFVLASAVAQGYLMLLSRALPPVEYGVLVTLTSLSYGLTVLMRTSQAWVIRAVADGEGAGRARGVFGAAMRTLVPPGIALLAAAWVTSGWVAGFLRMDATAPLFVLGLYAFAAFLEPVGIGLLLGLGRLRLAGTVIVLEAVLRLAVGSALVLLGLGVAGALFGYAAGSFGAFAIALWPLRSHLRKRPAGSAPASTTGVRLDRHTFLALVMNACLLILMTMDQAAVKHYFSDEVAGNFAVAFLLGQVIAVSAMSLGWVVFTRSAALPPGDPGRGALLSKALLAVGGIAGALTTGYLLAPELAVAIMGGRRYALAGGYVGWVGIEMTLVSLVYVQAYYQMSIRQVQAAGPLALAAALEVALLWIHHDSVQQLLLGHILVMTGLLGWVSILSWRTLRRRSSGSIGAMVP